MKGIALQKRVKPFSPSLTKPATAAAQEEIGAMIQIGAAVESIRYASFSFERPYLSVIGRITEPTVRQLK